MNPRKQSFRFAPLLKAPEPRLINRINRKLVGWGPIRVFPWREKTISPFQMLITEILLTKTRAETVGLVIEDLWRTFPDANSMANSPLDEIQAIIAPLGLLKRTAMLKSCAQKIRQIGYIPNQRKLLLQLPGVGGYVADAVRLFAFNIPVLPIDAVIGRILRRVLGYGNFGPAYADANLWNAVQHFAKGRSRKKVVASLLDLGAILCTPRKPKCSECPIHKLCKFGRQTGGG